MPDPLPKQCDVTIMGAGPAGTAIAAWLADRGIESVILEAQQFPRFSIGESLLPEALNCLQQAGLLDLVAAAGYQHKDGAMFATNHQQFSLQFGHGCTAGRGDAYQVPRACFDKLLADACVAKGVNLQYQTQVEKVEPSDDGFRLQLRRNNEPVNINTRFLVDASGYGRILARQFKLEQPSGMAAKTALFCHLDMELDPELMDRNKILIAQTELSESLWYWLIPFTGNHCSIGVVTDYWQPGEGETPLQRYQQLLGRQTLLASLTRESTLIREVGSISAYSASIARLYGDRYVILGNAGEFIDPIFSSGVTIALKSAMLAAPLVKEAVRGKPGAANELDWQGRFQEPLMAGVDTFKEYVNAWYEGSLPKLFYAAEKEDQIYRMICSILAGYVWDRSNPFTRMTARKLKSLSSIV